MPSDTLVLDEPPTLRTVDAPSSPGRLRTLLPGALLILFAVVVLRHYGVGLRTQARFAAYLLGVVLLPGLLAWRGLRGRSDRLAVDIVGGATLGYPIEILTYLLGRWLGFPYLPMVVAALIIVGFAATPRLRRHWRGSGLTGSALWSWTVAGISALIVTWEAITYFRPHGLTWPGYANPYPDMVFHQAVVGELKHHLPAQMPYVAGVPLRYHWFVHVDWAATSWGTGIEPYLLTYRLGLLPAVILLVVAMAVVARRIVPQGWWAGPLAAALALFAIAPDPAGWVLTAVPPADLPRTMWPSPTQTFGGMLFAGAVLALVDLLRPDRAADLSGQPTNWPVRTADLMRLPTDARVDRPSWRSWAAFTLAIAGATGGKATYAPLLIAGLLTVAGVDLLRRRWNGRALIAAAITAVAFAIADYTMFRGTSAGLFFDPLESTRLTVPHIANSGWTPWHALAIWALGWAAILLAVALLAWRRQWTDPMLTLCAGIGVAALGVVLLTYQMGGSQMYFLQSARPYLAVLVVAALVAIWPGRWYGWLLPPAIALGAAVTLLGERISPSRVPLAADGGALTARILWPYALPLLAAAALAAFVWLLRPLRPAALLLGAALLIGAGIPTAVSYTKFLLPRVGGAAAQGNPLAPGPAVIPRGAPTVGRWLRANTSTSDLLATNDHCRFATGQCDPRQFWLAAFSERRVLVEGWAFTPPANAIAAERRLGSNKIPYWDPPRLAENDAAFLHPSPASVGLLASRYGVRWLVVDQRRPYDAAVIGTVARLRFAAGQIAVYEVS